VQDVIYVKRILLPMLEKFPPHTKEHIMIGAVVHHLDTMNENLRQSCFELHPYLLQRVGLVSTIKKQIDLELGSCSFDIQFTTEHEDMIETADEELKRHLFRMFQELINNAKKHSKASIVKVKLTAVNRHISLSYQDDGVGFDMDSLEKRQSVDSILTFGLGLQQMKSRVLHMGGHLEYQSSPGKGMVLHLRIPLEGRAAV